jgi:hypothetical protein
MAKTTDKSRSVEIEVSDLQQEEVTFCILGETPFYCNRVTEKAKRELLFPRGRLTTAQKSNHLKHDPLEEYRNSPYCRKGDGPTRIMMMATAFKGAIGQAAIDMPTAVARAQIDRLVYVVDEFVPIFGIPMLDMAVVRSADMARTPDIRTRARINKWASVVTIRYTLPMVTEKLSRNCWLLPGLCAASATSDNRKARGITDCIASSIAMIRNFWRLSPTAAPQRRTKRSTIRNSAIQKPKICSCGFKRNAKHGDRNRNRRAVANQKKLKMHGLPAASPMGRIIPKPSIDAIYAIRNIRHLLRIGRGMAVAVYLRLKC